MIPFPPHRHGAAGPPARAMSGRQRIRSLSFFYPEAQGSGRPLPIRS